MSSQQDAMTKKRVVLQVAGMDRVTIRRDMEYLVIDQDRLTMDVFYPPDQKAGTRIPAVVFVTGFSDPGAQKMLGCKMKEMESYISWGELTAASGMAAITYSNREPARDVRALIQYVRQNAASLGIDENNIGIWASSGNVPTALSLLMQEAGEYLKGAVLSYGYMLDFDEFHGVAEAQKQWGFANPLAGEPVGNLTGDIPLFIVRAGQDKFSQLNESIDRFLARALSCNLPVKFANYPELPHSFDILHDSETSRETIREMLRFMKYHLGSHGGGEEVSSGPVGRSLP